MTNILDLHGWRYLEKRQNDKGIELHAEYTVDQNSCLKCGFIGNLYKHGFTNKTYLDCPMWGKPIHLLAKVRRYKCQVCGSTFLQPLGAIDTSRRMTIRALEYIQQQSMRDTFQQVAKHLGCDEKTVRNVANEYIEGADDGYKPNLPEWIGLDEIPLNKIMRVIITDLAAEKPVEMLPNREKPTVRQWFEQFNHRSHVQGLAIAMWAPYRDVAAELFPNLPIIIDKSHVFDMANSCVERSRLRFGKAQGKKAAPAWTFSNELLWMRPRDLSEEQRLNLEILLENEPEIATAYHLKERLFNIYDKSKAEAIADYDSFADDVPTILEADFYELTKAMRDWRKEILNYFDHPITNAHTESLKKMAEMANRVGRGYSFEVIRARILFADRKPLARQSRTHRVSQAPLVDEPMKRCGYCQGLFFNNELEGFAVEHFRPKDMSLSLQTPNIVIVCHNCNSRFRRMAEN
ncbi:ISL3 family transposase [Massilia varians]|jgi:transposase|uniref:ISL3 family transposase n=1 Tax=Massilia varians TaxID=457921 RepID=UPI002552869B|nr:ISL3 family transposase [Massilia varians]MDK6080194.1 ISL3 family transposase [Massilia varians]